MFCSKCGAAMANVARYCSRCGAPTDWMAAHDAQSALPGAALFADGARPNVPNHMAFSILMILWFPPLGIPAFIYSSRVGKHLAQGDVAGAEKESNKARLFGYLSLIAGLLFTVALAVEAARLLLSSLPIIEDLQ